MDSALMVERMYYIVDGRGNYYRVNAEDQLIVSQNRAGADLFEFKEANKRIGGGRKMNFYSILPAEEEEQETEKEGVDIKETVEYTEATDTEVDSYEYVSDWEEEENDISNLKAVQYEYDLERLDWKEFLLHLSYVISGLKNFQDKMSDDLSKVDLCICDLMHYLELYDLSEDDYIKTASLLKHYREERRVIKDKYNIAEWFQNAIGTQANLSKVKTVIKQIESLDHRLYAPRMLPDIFANAKPATKRNVQVEEPMEECCEITEETEMVREKLVRRKTKFDSGENDWLRMAEEQAQFFGEAKQYACNLQLTLNMVDEDIEQIMLLMEETNCNAAEGYKTFKQLRDLRNERKRVMNELESVQIITNCFACEEMRDAYQYCADRIRNM